MKTQVSMMAPASQNVQEPSVVAAAAGPLALQMIPSVHQTRDPVQLATAMRSLVLDQRHPIALEIVGTDQQRSFVIRARNTEDLAHVKTQLHARFPHATFVPLMGHDDPFHLEAQETVSVVELRAGQPSYLPLQEFEQMQAGEDPILGILGALDALPSDLRAIAQIALVPAAATWSKRYQRKAVEHALEPERQQDRQKQAEARTEGGAPSMAFLLAAALLLAGILFTQRFGNVLPAWILPTLQTLLHGEWQPVLAGPHHLEVEGVLGGLAVLLALPLIVKYAWSHAFQTPLYDMRSVAAKIARPAYQVRLRLYVIGPGAYTATPPTKGPRFRLAAREGWIGLCHVLSLIRARQWKQAASGLLMPLWQSGLYQGGRRVWMGSRHIVGYAHARQWKQARSVLFLPLWQSRWVSKLYRVARRGWLSIRDFGHRIRTQQWRSAARLAVMPWFLIMKGGWWVVRRLAVALFGTLKRGWQNWRITARERARRKQVLARLLAAYRQYHQANGNYFVPKRVHTRRACAYIRKGRWWKGVRRSRHLIDVEALAALWHAPSEDVLPEFARMAYHRGRSRLLPPSLQQAQDERPIGVSEHAGHRVAFGIPADALESHMLIGGKSGEGKSTLMQHLALRSMLEEGGLIVIDPHGDLVEQMLRLVPEKRAEDVVYIDLSDELFACGINPLDTTMARGRDKIISDLIKIFSKLWTSWGSRMEISFEYALRTLYEANKHLCRHGKEARQYTLLDIMPLLTDESFCHALLEEIEDPFVRRWWASYYDPLSLQMQRDRVDPVLSKVAKFEGIIARHIVGQSRCSIDFAACIEQQKIVLIKLAKGVIGEDSARILGATLLGFLNVALEEQGKVVGAKRRRFPILIDEFQTLDGVDWGALAELRKYGAAFFLATQSLEYLRDKQILSVVLANVKQFATFRMSAEDARILARELDVDPEDIVHLESLTCYLKLVHQRRQHPTFSCTLSFPPEALDAQEERAQQIRAFCQRRLMRPVSEIETEIIERLARQIGAVPKGLDHKPQQMTLLSYQEGQARETGGGYRGRRSQEQKKNTGPSASGAPTPAITPMNWKETVGEPASGEEHEHESDDDGL